MVLFLFEDPLVDKPNHQDDGDDNGADDDEFHVKYFRDNNAHRNRFCPWAFFSRSPKYCSILP
jgi:hypothetical protein